MVVGVFIMEASSTEINTSLDSRSLGKSLSIQVVNAICGRI